MPLGSFVCTVVRAAQWEGSHVFSAWCVHERSQEVVLWKLQWSNVVVAAAGSDIACTLCRARCYSQLSPFPIQSSSRRIRLLYCVCFSSLPTTPPLTGIHKPLNRFTQAGTRTEAVGLLSGPTWSSTSLKWLFVLFLRGLQT